jgi:hypothetical protein
MGYSTSYYIKAVDLNPGHGSPLLDETFFNELEFDETSPGDEYWEPSVHPEKKDMFWFGRDDCRWYAHSAEVRAASTKHRDIVFILDGEGEETGDIWREFYLNGELVHSWSPDIKPPEWEDVLQEKAF